MMQTATQLSTRQVADLFGVPTWQIQRLFECGILPEPRRFAGKRVIAGESLPAIVDALRERGWLPREAPEAEVASV
jgi:hypothetical protein